jgi:hypothetical protein
MPLATARRPFRSRRISSQQDERAEGNNCGAHVRRKTLYQRKEVATIGDVCYMPVERVEVALLNSSANRA